MFVLNFVHSMLIVDFQLFLSAKFGQKNEAHRLRSSYVAGAPQMQVADC